MDLFIEYFPFILIIAFFIFLIYAILNLQKVQKTVLTRQSIPVDRQEHAIKLTEETNTLLSEILAEVKKK